MKIGVICFYVFAINICFTDGKQIRRRDRDNLHSERIDDSERFMKINPQDKKSLFNDKNIYKKSPSETSSHKTSDFKVELDATSDFDREEISFNDPVRGHNVQPDGTIAQFQGHSPLSALFGETMQLSSHRTINSMTIETRWVRRNSLSGTLQLFGSAKAYTLSDDSAWNSGAGSSTTYYANFDRVEVSGNEVLYYLRPTTNRLIYSQVDYNAGDHSSAGILAASGDLILKASINSTTAVLSSGAEIIENEPKNYKDSRFHYFSAIVGSVVPFNLTYELTSGTWQTDTFSRSFSYRVKDGFVNFSNPISVPAVVGFMIIGPPRVLFDTMVQYQAQIQYENNRTTTITDAANWTVSPASIASIDGGLLSTVEIVPEGGTDIEILAVYRENNVVFNDTKTVRLIPQDNEDHGTWSTYQGNPGHTGYVAMTVDPEDFTVLWERIVSLGRELQQVAAGDNRVFVSIKSRFIDDMQLFALDARDGEQIWSQGFGKVNSVNPPALAYGNVYIQTGKVSSQGSPPQLHAFDSATGKVVFTEVFSAQWESYLAPTIYDGRVYISGGYYGGMYCFDAFVGDQSWYLGLPQYDDWTPAVDENYAYAYVGSYQPGLFVVDRISGDLVFRIPDDEFNWNGWSMDLAPVLGGQNDVIAIHGGRLIRFDVAERKIGWQKKSSFSGQPSVKDGIIYAIDGGNLIASDQMSGELLWKWTTPSGDPLRDQIIVTDTHIFVRTTTKTLAVELLSPSVKWEYNKAGDMALGNDALYIAQRDGTLTAISIPEVIPAKPASLKITIPQDVTESSTTQLSALVSYEDGRIRDCTQLANWSLRTSEDLSVDYKPASISTDGVLSVQELFEPDIDLIVYASYEQYDTSVSSQINITVKINVTAAEFIQRHLETARKLQENMIPILEMAHKREEAARSVLADIASGTIVDAALSPDDAKVVQCPVRNAMMWYDSAMGSFDNGIDQLGVVLHNLNVTLGS